MPAEATQRGASATHRMVLVAAVLAIAFGVAVGVTQGLGALGRLLGSADGAGQVGVFAAQLLIGPLPVVAATVLYRLIDPDQGPAPDVAPQPWLPRRATATLTALAVLTQLIAIALPAPVLAAGADPVDVLIATDPASPFPAGTPVDVRIDVDDPTSAEKFPTGTLAVFIDSVEVGGSPFTLADEFTDVTTIITQPFTAGPHTIEAFFTPDPDPAIPYAPGQGSLAVVAGDTTTTALTPSPAATVFGEPLTLTAQVATTGASPPTGDVEFLGLGVSPAPTATVDASGVATLVTRQATAASLPATLSLTARYLGDAANLESTSGPVTVDIDPAATQTRFTTAPPSPSAAGAALEVTVEVTVTNSWDSVPPEGTAVLYEVDRSSGSTVLTELGSGRLANSRVTLPFSLPPGSHGLRVRYLPDTGFLSSEWEHSTARATSAGWEVTSTSGSKRASRSSLRSSSGSPAEIVARRTGRALCRRRW